MKILHRLEIIFWLLCGLTLPRSAMSHDGWVEISPTIVERNQPATIALIQGNHSNEHKSYRIAGKWDQKYTTLVVIDPKAKQNSLTERLIDFGEDAETVGPKGPKGYHLTSFVPQDGGSASSSGATGTDRSTRRRAEAGDRANRQDSFRGV